MRQFALAFTLALAASASPLAADSYCVIIKQAVLDQAEWKAVAESLLQKHDGKLITYQKTPDETLARLQQEQPRYTCFVTPHRDADGPFVAAIHQLTRKLDEDPYTDTMWGILTGFDAANALAIAQHNEPLTVRKVASGTEVALEMCEQGLYYDELVKNKWVRKQPGDKAKRLAGPDDTTAALVNTLNDYRPDLFVTSGHATQRNWQIGFRYRSGYFKSAAGQMIGQDTQGKRWQIDSPNAKVYLPIGNCLMGNIDGPDAMALAWMNDVGVKQMIGYTVPTWFGYGGWGVLDYFVEQPGRYTLTEAFFANHQALIHALETKTGNARGLAFDRDVVAFYGDPKWEARMAPAVCAYEQSLTTEGGMWTFRVEPQRGQKSFEPINVNGSQRGYRPIIQWLPQRLKNVRVISGAELAPLITENFLLIPNPRDCDVDRGYKVVFTAESWEASED